MRRILSSMKLPTGFHVERLKWLYEGTNGSAVPTSNGSTKVDRAHVLYWMQTSMRTEYNYALEYAIAASNALQLPLHVVYFLSDGSVAPEFEATNASDSCGNDKEDGGSNAKAGYIRITEGDPNAHGFATERHAKFALEGLCDVQTRLKARGVSFAVFHHFHQREVHPQQQITPEDSSKAKEKEYDGKEKQTTKKQPPNPAISKEDHVKEADPTMKRPTRSDLLHRCARHATLVVTDRPYLRPWQEDMDECVHSAKERAAKWTMVQVEGDIVVPCECASIKEEFAARTIRPKITSQLSKFLTPLEQQQLQPEYQTASESSSFMLHEDDTADLSPLVLLDVTDVSNVLKILTVDRSITGISDFTGGEEAAKKILKSFLDNKLAKYADERNEPSGDGGSNLSLYLRYGHISSVQIALEAKKRTSPNVKAGKESFLEELIVRRELSINMIVYNADYDSMACLPEYALTTLEIHAEDKREHLFTLQELEAGKTYDVYWNAAQLEVIATGRMHGYMRMYWAKKILEWTKTPEEGYEIALYLNNKYALDAPDPNSYTGIAWAFGKHDQGWKERPIFGKVRYMNESGLKRKFRMDAYVRKVQEQAKKLASFQLDLIGKETKKSVEEFFKPVTKKQKTV